MRAFSDTTFFPRARGRHWQQLTELRGTSLDDLELIPIDLRHAEFHPAAETKVKEGELLAWREDLNAWAHNSGYPGNLTEKARSDWDVALGARLLADTEEIPEAQHPAVWCWLATNLLPHLIVYRWGWPKSNGDDPPTGRDPWARFGPSDKNGLLLARQRVQTYGTELARRATEQEFQSIQYRPAFGLDQRVARLVLETMLTALDDPTSNYGKNGGGRALDANDVCIEIRLINSLRPLSFATDDEIVAIVNDAIERLPTYRKATNQKASESTPS